MSEPVSWERDGHVIQGRLRRARGDGHGSCVLLLQGSPGNPEDVLGLGRRFSDHGYDAVTFNYSGTLDSGGLSSFEEAQRDIAVVHDWIVSNDGLGLDSSRLFLGGWSYGGGMAMVYAANHPEFRAVFSIAGTDHGEFMREYERDLEYRRMIDSIFDEMAQPGSHWRLAPGATPRDVVADEGSVDPYDIRMVAARLADTSVLLVGGWDDTNVKIDTHLVPVYRTLRAHGAADVSISSFQDGHDFGNVRDDLAATLLAWMDERR